MQEFSGTKGPWEVFNNDGEDMVIQSGSLERGRGWIGYTCIAAEFQNENDALLIAAAPELLEALQDAEKALFAALDNAFGEELANGNRELIQARAAIARALGQ